MLISLAAVHPISISSGVCEEGSTSTAAELVKEAAPSPNQGQDRAMEGRKPLARQVLRETDTELRNKSAAPVGPARQQV